MASSTHIDVPTLRAKLDACQALRDRAVERQQELLIAEQMEAGRPRSFLQWLLRRPKQKMTWDEARQFLIDEQPTFSKGQIVPKATRWESITRRWNQYDVTITKLRWLAYASSDGMVTISVDQSWLFDMYEEQSRVA